MSWQSNDPAARGATRLCPRSARMATGRDQPLYRSVFASAIPCFHRTATKVVGDDRSLSTSPKVAMNTPLRVHPVLVIVDGSSLVECSTTGADPVDGLETGWTEPHFREPGGPTGTKTTTLPRCGPRVRIPSPAPSFQVRVSFSTSERTTRWPPSLAVERFRYSRPRASSTGSFFAFDGPCETGAARALKMLDCHGPCLLTDDLNG
jgi:hypothetical protein